MEASTRLINWLELQWLRKDQIVVGQRTKVLSLAAFSPSDSLSLSPSVSDFTFLWLSGETFWNVFTQQTPIFQEFKH